MVVTILLAVIAGLSYVLFGADGADNPEAVGVNYYKVQEIMDGRMVDVTVIDPSLAYIVSASTYFLVSLLLTVLATVVMTGLGFFASVLVRSAAVSTGLAMGVVVMGLVIQGTARGMGFLKGLATTHFDLGRVWSGEVYQSFGVSTTLSESLLILLAWSAGMYLLGYYLFTRRDILA
ncbi:hypothetical protein N6H14_01605 [Paenibacillus sp. CC-CFT747]|nr:hypothetical protein N6H14_01605 [Paenibacillus sp. CC-CFT747]